MNALTEHLKDAREEYGFTLIELLVVILIIGILAAIAVPAFLNQRQAANSAAVESDLRNAATEFETANISNYGKSVRTSAPEDIGGTPVALAQPSTIAAINILAALTPPQFHTSPGVNVDVLTYNNDGTYCLVGTHQNSWYMNGAVATYDSAAGGLNKTGGACPASLLTPGGDNTVETPVDGAVDEVAVGGTGWFIEEGSKSGTGWEAVFTASFTDTDMSEAELRTVAESANLTRGFTATPASIAVSGNTATATFDLAGNANFGGYGDPFNLNYTNLDGTTQTYELWFNTQDFNPTPYQAANLVMWTTDRDYADASGIRHAPYAGGGA